MWFELLKRDITSDDIVEMPDEVAERAKELLDSTVRDSPHAKWINSNQISLTPDWLPISLFEGWDSGYSMGFTYRDMVGLHQQIENKIGIDAIRILRDRPAGVRGAINGQMHITEIIVTRSNFRCLTYSVNLKPVGRVYLQPEGLVNPKDYPIHIQACFSTSTQKGGLPLDDYIVALILAAGEKSTWIDIWKDV